MVAAHDEETVGRSARKRRAILDAGQQLFLRKGFDRTTMDEVAALARVSKQTVYKHFADKAKLFAAIIHAEIAAAEEVTHDQVAALGASRDRDDLERDLRTFARQHVADVTSPDVVIMRRIVIAEAERFPELASTWYAAGPAHAHEALAEQLAELDRRGMLDVPDPALAAQHLNWLIISIPLNEATFAGEPVTFDDAQLHRYAVAAIDVFLAAYGRRAPDPRRRREA